MFSNDDSLDRFLFRDIHPGLLLGTASDRYAGWIGQIYTPEKYEGRIKKRTKTVGGTKLVEEVLPVDSVKEYFEHFGCLELDFTFYAPLLDEKGKPSRNYHTLKSYSKYLRKGDRILLKVPQVYFAQKMWQDVQGHEGQKEFAKNPYYLDPRAFTSQFYKPALELMGPWLAGFLFEQEYHRKKDRPDPKEVAQELDAFFDQIPQDYRYHVELRTEAFLCPEVFEVFERRGVGQILSHWTWLPSLARQFRLSGGRIFSRSNQLVIRLMTPRGMRYEDAYIKAHPFDKLIPGMLQESMLRDTARIAVETISKGATVYVIINNRAGGNAPLIAKRVVNIFLKAIVSDE